MTASVPPPRITTTGRLVAGILAVAAIWAYVSLFRDTFIDDAFISLKYSASLAQHGEWSFLPGRPSNTATSPLNVIVNAAVSLVMPSMTAAVVVTTTVELVVLLLLLRRISAAIYGHAYFGWLAFAALAANCLLVSTFGLEGTLFTALLAWSVERYLARSWSGLGVALGALVLARPDGALLFLIYSAALFRRREFRLRFLTAFVLTIAPWFLFSWIHLGSFVPDTLQIKMSQAGWGRNLSYFSGLGFYARRYPLEFISSFALLPFTAFAWRPSNPSVSRVSTIVGLYGVLHLAAYWVMRVPPYHWYYVNEVVPVAIVGALGLTNVLDRAWKASRVGSRVALGALAGIPAVSLVISVAHLGLPLKEAPMHTNWATHSQYRQIGLWIHDHIPDGVTIFEVSEIGTVSFYAQRFIVNEFSDSNRTFGAIVERFPTLPWPARLAIEVNFFWRRLQPAVPEAQYSLMQAPLPNPKEPELAGRIVTSWDTSTRWVPHGRLYLLKRSAATEGK